MNVDTTLENEKVNAGDSMKYVLYHSKCYDGFGAAWAAYKALEGPAAFVAVSYGYPPPPMPEAKEIYIVDFSYPKDVLLELAKTAQVTVIDHHKTAEAMLADLKGCENPKVIFDMEKSGALLTWEFFHGQTPPPKLIEHISDRDLWTFKLDGTAKIHKALVSYPMEFQRWDAFDVEELKKEGATCERLYTQLVDNVCEGAFDIELDGHKIKAVNTSIAWSEVGAELGRLYPESPFVASFTVFDTQVMWSLRSQGEFDVSAIAKKFGGGGHKNAAGFKTVKV